MAQQKLWIRIHPRSKQERNPPYRVQRMHIYGRLFREEDGWHLCEYSDEQWDYLREVRQRNADPDSKPVFDIVTPAERARIDARESSTVREVPVVPALPPDLTTAELRGDGTGKASEAVEQERDARAVAFDEGGDIAPSAPPAAPVAAAPKKRGRPKKVSATEG
jgi:hypothetical protein